MPSHDEQTSQVEATTQSWIDAFNAHHPAVVCALYHSDAVLWGTTAQSLITTPEGIRQYFEHHCGPESLLTITLTSHHVRVMGDTAINSGSYTLNAHIEGQLRLLPARYTFTYRRVGEQWLIVDHHSSFLPVSV